MVTRRMSHPEPSRTRLRSCPSRRLSRRAVLCGNSSMLFLHDAMAESFWYLAEFSWCNEDSENSCAQSVNEHIPQVLWIFSGTGDHVGIVRPHQNGPRRPGHSTFSSQFNIHHIEPKPISTFRQKREPRVCLSGHPRIWDFGVDPRPSVGHSGKCKFWKKGCMLTPKTNSLTC